MTNTVVLVPTPTFTVTLAGIQGPPGATLPVPDTINIVRGSNDDSKIMRFEVDGFTTGTTRTLTPQNKSYTLADHADVLAASAAATAAQADIDGHKADTNNPHATTKSQVGLGNVANVDTSNASNISSGTLPAARLPTPTLTTLGGVRAVAAVDHNFVNAIDTSGVPSLAQPAAGDISGLAASATTDTTNAANISSGTLPAARLPIFIGDSGLGGVKGAVPAPASGDAAAGKYLKADGTFAVPPSGSTLPVVDSTGIAKGSSDASKILRFEVDGFTTGTTRALTPQDKNYTIADKADLDAHVADTANPHTTTKAQIGLGNVPNTDATNASNLSSGTVPSARLALTISDLSFAGSANGVATLDGTGKVPTSQLPAAVLGAVAYQGTWNANTNSPSITTSSASSTNKGYYYKVSVAGSTTVDGESDWKVGDWIISDGSAWTKVDNTETVSSVNGYIGAVSLVKGDIGLGNVANVDTTNASNISSGTLPAARLPNPSASALGGVQSIAAVSHRFLTSISTSGVPGQAQPDAADITGLAASATTDATNASNIASGTLAAARMTVMVGDSGSGGTKGAVPAPGAGDAAAGKYLKADGTFAVPPGNATVTSVNITAPSAGITASGGPITTSGSITLALADDLGAIEALTTTGFAKRTGTSAWSLVSNIAASDFANQTANLVLAGPTTGSAAAPTFRALVAADLPAQPFVAAGRCARAPSASEVIFAFKFPIQVIFPSGLTNTQAEAATAATAQTDFDIQMNGSSIGTMRFAASGTVPSFIFSSQTTFAAGDNLKVIAPATPDATLADVWWSFYGTR